MRKPLLSLEPGDRVGIRGGVISASINLDRVFVHLDHGGRTTWELFPACFWDGEGPDDLYIGRWLD